MPAFRCSCHHLISHVSFENEDAAGDSLVKPTRNLESSSTHQGVSIHPIHKQ
jgi:hypothetical protein